MSTPDKPRPSLDDTLRHIDAVLAEPVVRDGNTFTVNQPGVYKLTWNPGGSGEPSVAERARAEAGQIRAELRDLIGNEPYLKPALDAVQREFDAAALGVQLGHRRSCQHDGPPGPTCPGCAAIDADLAAAKAAATPQEPERGWLARALHRLFG